MKFLVGWFPFGVVTGSSLVLITSNEPKTMKLLVVYPYCCWLYPVVTHCHCWFSMVVNFHQPARSTNHDGISVFSNTLLRFAEVTHI